MDEKKPLLWFITASDINAGTGRAIGIKSRIKVLSKDLDIILITHEKVKDEEIQAHIRENPVHGVRLYRPHLRKPYYWFKLLSLFKRIDKIIDEPFPIIYTDTSYIPFYKLFTGKKIRIIYMRADMDTEILISKGFIRRGGVPHKIVSFYEQRGLRRADRIITVTNKIKGIITERYKIPGEKITVLPNGVDTYLFTPELDGTEVLEKLGWEDKKIVFWLGNFRPWQGVEYIVKAAPIIIRNEPDTRFLLVGSGDGAEKIKAEVSDLGLADHFAFAGKIPHKRVPTYIATADVCVAYFAKKGRDSTGLSPLKLYEYLSCGKTVVGSNVGGVGEFLTRHKCGLGILPEDHESLAKAIVELLGNKRMRDEMGKNGRTIIERRYSWEKICREIIRIYRELDFHRNHK